MELQPAITQCAEYVLREDLPWTEIDAAIPHALKLFPEQFSTHEKDSDLPGSASWVKRRHMLVLLLVKNGKSHSILVHFFLSYISSLFPFQKNSRT